MAKANSSNSDESGTGWFDKVKNLMTNKVGIALVGALVVSLAILYVVVV